MAAAASYMGVRGGTVMEGGGAPGLSVHHEGLESTSKVQLGLITCGITWELNFSHVPTPWIGPQASELGGSCAPEGCSGLEVAFFGVVVA